MTTNDKLQAITNTIVEMLAKENNDSHTASEIREKLESTNLPIFLSDILRLIAKHSVTHNVYLNYDSSSEVHEAHIEIAHYTLPTSYYWNLSVPFLDEQSEETINAIYNLIFNK